MSKKIEISHRTIIFTVLFSLALYLVLQVLDIFVMLFVAFILMSALKPFVDRLESLKLSRSLSIIIVYLLLWGVLGGLVASLVPTLIEQTNRLIRILPPAIAQIEFFSAHQQAITEQLLTRIGSLPENILKVFLSLFGNMLNVLTTLVMTFYLLLYRNSLHDNLKSFLQDQHRLEVLKYLENIEKRLGSWVRGELILMFSIGFMTYIGLTMLGIDGAVPLAIIAGLLEVIPSIGPTISAIPAVIVALTYNPFMAVATMAMYVVVQFLENNLLVPKIMQRAIGINPLISITALMAGFKLAGPVGAVLALPLIIVIQTLGPRLLSLNNIESISSDKE